MSRVQGCTEATVSFTLTYESSYSLPPYSLLFTPHSSLLTSHRECIIRRPGNLNKGSAAISRWNIPPQPAHKIGHTALLRHALHHLLHLFELLQQAVDILDLCP